MVALAVNKPPVRGLRQGSAQWLRPKLRVRVRHLRAKGVLRHATVRQLITDKPRQIRRPAGCGFFPSAAIPGNSRTDLLQWPADVPKPLKKAKEGEAD